MSETVITNVSPATTTNCGVVKVGNGLSVTDDGMLSAKTHGNETWISTSFTFYGSGSWTVESSNTYEEIVSWFDSYDRVFATLVAGSGNTFEFGESYIELLKDSSGSIVSMPINIKYETKLSTITDELRVIMDDGMAFTTVTASSGNAPDTVTITWDGVSSSQNWERVDALYKAGKRLQVFSTEWDGEYILPLVSVISQGNNLYIFSAHYSDGRRAVVKFWRDPSIPDGSPQKEIFSEISDYPVASKTSLGVIKVGDGLSVDSNGTLSASGAGGGAELTTVTKKSGSTNVGIESSIRFIAGYCYCYIINYYIKSTSTGSLAKWQMEDADGNDILLSSMGTNPYYQSFTPMSSNTGTWDYQTVMGFVPRSTSAQAALATLLPVQDECEQMEAEVAKLEQDWIDNPDETVAVDGNGVPITIATKKTELKKKQAELEKLREDYFSKLGDWKNEVQE